MLPIRSHFLYMQIKIKVLSFWKSSEILFQFKVIQFGQWKLIGEHDGK
jgi:hypothetical protein